MARLEECLELIDLDPIIVKILYKVKIQCMRLYKYEFSASGIRGSKLSLSERQAHHLALVAFGWGFSAGSFCKTAKKILTRRGSQRVPEPARMISTTWSLFRLSR